jgi:hypothetical protein
VRIPTRPAGCCRWSTASCASSPRSGAKVEDISYFDYEAAEKLHVYDKQAGLDFALIPLREWYGTTLSGNGVRAIS